jgi:hypothetical protein
MALASCSRSPDGWFGSLFIWPSQQRSLYIGEFQRGIFDGFGVYASSQGDRFQGQFKFVLQVSDPSLTSVPGTGSHMASACLSTTMEFARKGICVLLSDQRHGDTVQVVGRRGACQGCRCQQRSESSRGHGGWMETVEYPHVL